MIRGVKKGCATHGKVGKWPHAVCRKVDEYNSVMYSKCGKRMPKRCSGIEGNLKDVASFSGAVCAGAHVAPVRLGSNSVVEESLEPVAEFCYMGDKI